MVCDEIKVNLFIGSRDRVTKSNGSVMVSEINGTKCIEPTFVPKEPWVELDNEDYDKLISNNKKKYNDISLVKLPNHLIRTFVRMRINNCINYNEISFIQHSEKWTQVIEKTQNYISKWNVNKTTITPHMIYFGKPNLKNNTFNTLENVYIGMHLDSWEGDPLDSRNNSRNRICINLGKQPRYLLFYNISIKTMAEQINFDTTINNDVNLIYKNFASKFPEIPIYRLKIEPFEAYIASTEFIIHDGSSWCSEFPDINLTFRGRFFIKKLNVFKKIFNYLNTNSNYFI